MIRTRFAMLEYTPDGAVSRFLDGTGWGAQPHDLPHYHHAAFRMGYEGNTLAYCRDHELAHHLVSEEFGHTSRVLWPLAHGVKPNREEAASEEALAMALQRFAMTHEPPLVDGVDWDRLRATFLVLKDENND